MPLDWTAGEDRAMSEYRGEGRYDRHPDDCECWHCESPSPWQDDGGESGHVTTELARALLALAACVAWVVGILAAFGGRAGDGAMP